MFEYIKGSLQIKEPHQAVVDVQGVGYQIKIALSTYSKLPDLGKVVTLYTSFIVREDAQTLFGFLSRDERSFFEMIITVSGIGPKTGLALIGHLDLATLEAAIQANNTALISKTPGIGKKTAERLIIELKDKVAKISSASMTSLNGHHLFSDAVQALVNLGYHPMHAQKAVQSVMKQDFQDLGKIITSALQVI